jgi:hypothetical protein
MITDEHKAFARAVVELARKHKISNVDLTFRENFWHRDEPGTSSLHNIEVRWSEGRHQARDRIHIKTVIEQALEEEAPSA